MSQTLLNGAIFHEDYDDMVVVKDIEFYSLCEHHMLPFFGKAHVAYIPNGKIVGLSKIPRLVDMFARRLQVQERLTTQIAEALEDALQPKGVAVVIEGAHMCMLMRGVQKQECQHGHFPCHGRVSHGPRHPAGVHGAGQRQRASLIAVREPVPAPCVRAVTTVHRPATATKEKEYERSRRCCDRRV